MSFFENWLESKLREIVTPDMVSLWIPSGQNRAMDIIRDNHGQCYGTHPNMRTLSKFGDAGILINGDIENGFTNGIANGWSSTRGNGSDETVDVHADSHAQGITNPAGNTGVVAQEITIIVGKRYRLSCWAKKSKGSGGALREVSSSSFSPILITSAAYVKIEVEFTATGNLNLAFYTNSNAVDDTNGILFDTVILEELTDSLINPSLGWSFDGTDDYIDFGDPANGSLDIGLSDWSVFAWIKWDGSLQGSAHDGILGKSSATPYWTLRVKSYGQLWATIYGGAYEVYFSNALDDSRWHFIGFTVDRSGSLILYLDGANKDTSDISGLSATDISNAASFTLGAPANMPTLGLFNGYIALPFVVKTAWSIQQINNFYLATKGLFAPRG